MDFKKLLGPVIYLALGLLGGAIGLSSLQGDVCSNCPAPAVQAK